MIEVWQLRYLSLEKPKFAARDFFIYFAAQDI